MDKEKIREILYKERNVNPLNRHITVDVVETIDDLSFYVQTYYIPKERIERILYLHEEVKVGYTPEEKFRRLIYDLRQILSSTKEKGGK